MARSKNPGAAGERKMRRQVEAGIQASIVGYVRAVTWGKVIVFHVPNGGYRRISEAVRLKRMGVEAGVPDLMLLLPDGGLAQWEVKPPGGKLSEAQMEMFERMRMLGHYPRVVSSIEDARAELDHLGIETRESNWTEGMETGMDLRIWEHEAAARELALTDIDLDNQALVAAHLAASAMTRPKRGALSLIWNRARELRVNREFMRSHGRREPANDNKKRAA